MKFGIVVFPGSWSERDMHYAVADVLGYPAEYVWHRATSLNNFDAILLPGGFSYGDHLRCGAIAAHSPVMAAVKDFANNGGFVFGSCNGFQILCETGLLPGALIRNDHLEFRCEPGNLRVESSRTPFTSQYADGDVVAMPISHGEGNYQADDETLAMLESDGRVIFRYVDEDNEATPEANPNGSLNNIAGITNEAGNVLGMMPHPERACESLLGSSDGNPLWQSIVVAVDGGG
ncbi:MAG: phosphoribosylformylglycinamidine synthase subunit PurQ [Chloroflexi bacterium]|nr:phosphoribosylformylglycinamidine synthase subunit PurQ [Chloroflexota bacterium]MYK60763.1 phosphoribosylformylglycinamidine synthase subunit PurQ [Chloroflexota bacterium]